MNKERYARIELAQKNPEITLDEWKQIAAEMKNMEIDITDTGFRVYGYISDREYGFQLLRPDTLWMYGHFEGWFDDEFYENNLKNENKDYK